MAMFVPREHEIYRRITTFIVVFDTAGDSIRETHAWLHAIKTAESFYCALNGRRGHLNGRRGHLNGRLFTFSYSLYHFFCILNNL